MTDLTACDQRASEARGAHRTRTAPSGWSFDLRTAPPVFSDPAYVQDLTHRPSHLWNLVAPLMAQVGSASAWPPNMISRDDRMASRPLGKFTSHSIT